MEVKKQTKKQKAGEVTGNPLSLIGRADFTSFPLQLNPTSHYTPAKAKRQKKRPNFQNATGTSSSLIIIQPPLTVSQRAFTNPAPKVYTLHHHRTTTTNPFTRPNPPAQH
jgi:hypothetical protein